MPVNRYGLLKGQAIDSRPASRNSPHYEVHITDGAASHRIAINVQSSLQPNEVLFLVDEHFEHPITSDLVPLEPGKRLVPSQPGGLALDYIRGNLFDTSAMRPLPADVPGEDNDLNDKVDRYIRRAMSVEDGFVYAFGAQWGPEDRADRYFGFLPGSGIHDIHMNQGNSQQFVRDDGVWQDGGLLLHFPSDQQWVAVFLAFQSQTFHTDDVTGHALETAPEQNDQPVMIVAALVNPAGAGDAGETVLLLNRSAAPVSLDGWQLADKQKKKSRLNGIILNPREAAEVSIRERGDMQLSNDGGIITLLDAAGIKIHGVSYTKQDARREGWSVVF